MITPANRVWETVLGQLQLQVPKPSYETWLKETTGLSLDNGHFTVAVPSTFAAEWLERRLQALIQKALAEVAGQPLHVHFKVASPLTQTEAVPAEASNGDLSSAEVQLQPAPASGSVKAGNGINLRYTFANFVTGGSNQMAYAAARAVADRPGVQYNPLFIYAGVGLGKTHLLHAIAMYVASQGLTPLYVTTEQFTNEFIHSIRSRTTEDFRSKYRTPDVLLLDDIQFLSGKEQTQEGFFHTFNDLHNANRQIVVASDRAPGAVALLEDRLRSRFEWGLITDMQVPGLETRVAILQEKARSQGLALSNELALLLAQRYSGSVRELEGSLNRVAALASFLGVPITPEVVRTALPEVFAEPPLPSCTPEAAIASIAAFYGMSTDALVTRPRDRKTKHPQRMAMYILVEKLRETPEKVALRLGNWHMRTVANSLRIMASLLARETSVKEELSSLCKGLGLVTQ